MSSDVTPTSPPAVPLSRRAGEGWGGDLSKQSATPAVSSAPLGSPPEGVAVGFYGKVPARGDFVRAGLPRDFTDPWDNWLQSVLTGSRELMGDAWLPAFLGAPVWRFTLQGGICGERAVLGVMLPSVDKAGRYFPLTFATLPPVGCAIATDDIWLDRCEAAGRAALEQDASPDQLSDMLGAPDLTGVCDSTGTVWWTEGSPRVPPTRIAVSGMPGAAAYASMLGAPPNPGETASHLPGETPWIRRP